MDWLRFLRRRPNSREPEGVLRGTHDDPHLSDEELVAKRVQWFEFYTSQRNMAAPEAGGPYSCPCCGHLTLSQRGGCEICPECRWEDDGQDNHDSDVIRGGPNGRLSLDAARADYIDGGGTPLPHRPRAIRDKRCNARCSSPWSWRGVPWFVP
jgi:hypothetical protein